MLILAYGRIDQVLVYELAGDADAGLYGAVYRVLDRAQMVPIAVMATLFPMLAAAYGRDDDRARRMFSMSLQYLLAASLPLLAFCIVESHAIVRLLFGASYDAAAPALPVLMGAFVLISVGYLLGNTVIVIGLQRRLILYAAVALIFNVVANLLLIGRYGFMAAAWITLLTEVVVGGLTARAVFAELRLRPDLGAIGRVVAASAGMGLLVWVLRRAGVPLGGLVAVAAVAYPALALVTKAVDGPMVVRLLRREAG
jgi:O-antigen/teichoic acid export membrane protein